jgi:hypothetical protein
MIDGGVDHVCHPGVRTVGNVDPGTDPTRRLAWHGTMQPGRERPRERRRGDAPEQGWGSLTSWLLSHRRIADGKERRHDASTRRSQGARKILVHSD